MRQSSAWPPRSVFAPRMLFCSATVPLRPHHPAAISRAIVIGVGSIMRDSGVIETQRAGDAVDPAAVARGAIAADRGVGGGEHVGAVA